MNGRVCLLALGCLPLSLSCALVAQGSTSAPDVQTASAAQPAVVHAPYPTGASTPLGAVVAVLLADPAVSRAHWGIAVTALDGTPIYGHEEGQFFRPASNAKLYTSAAALAMLGVEKRFTTRVIGRGDIANGTLHGNLVLVGGGDANFDGGYALPYLAPQLRPKNATPLRPLGDFDDLAAQVAARGIRVIEGDVIGDDTYFEDTRYPEGWSTDDLLWGYGAPVSALTAHDNQLDLTITDNNKPGVSGRDTITLEPSVPFYTVNRPLPGEKAGTVWNANSGRNLVGVERDPGSRNFRVFGDVAAANGAETHAVAIDEPAAFAAAALRQALEKRGVHVTGTTHVKHWPGGFVGSLYKESHEPVFFANVAGFFSPGEVGCGVQAIYTGPGPATHLLAEKNSPPFAEDLKLTLKDSQNLHAEIMLRNIAAEKDCEHTLRKSLQLVRAYWVHAGLDGADFQFYDGSGLSAKDLVTPRATTQLLSYATRQVWFPLWKDALPVGGVDGSLRSRFAEAPLKGHVFAKTGTLGESLALSGYVDCASGRQVIFSIMVDDHSPANTADRVVMDKIVAAIAAEN